MLCQDCVAEDLISEESTLSKNTVFPDAACKRELNQLPVHCCYGSCDWSGLLKDFEKHSDSCLWFPLPCPVCHEMIARMQLEDHVTEHQRVVGLRVNPGDMCPFNCGQQVGDEGLQSHVRDQLSTHLQSVHQRLEMLESQLVVGEPRHESVVAQIDRLERQLLDLQSSSPRRHRTPGDVLPADTTSGAAAAAAVDAAGLDEITTELDVIEKVLQVLSMEANKMLEQMKTSENTQQQHNSMLDSLHARASALERAVAAHDVRMRDMESKLTAVEMTSYDGTLLWKITEVGRRRREAASNITTSSGSETGSILSPAFYTSRTGYKMFGRVYLNGDGGGRSTHLSLFLVIARGNFDALLRWPFTQRVTMTLLDQVAGRQHVTETFRPDRSSSAVQRPVGDINVATGFPKFVPLASLESPQGVYVRDDTMFIRISVDCRDL